MRVARATGVRRAGLGSALLLAAAVILAACSSNGSKSVAAGAPTGGTSPSGATVLVRSTKLGKVLTNAQGLTLYTFDQDAAGATTSACTGSCASAWPPLTATGTPVAGPGVTGTLATISGGQVTWDGHPLYRWSSDHAAGDVTGDGVNGFHAARATASASTSTTGATGTTY